MTFEAMVALLAGIALQVDRLNQSIYEANSHDVEYTPLTLEQALAEARATAKAAGLRHQSRR